MPNRCVGFKHTWFTSSEVSFIPMGCDTFSCTYWMKGKLVRICGM